METKIAIVTGGSRGIGRSAALRLAAAGVDVILTYHSAKTEADAVVEEIRAAGRQAAALQLDVGDIGALDGFVQAVKDVLAQRWGRETFHFLINNGAYSLNAPFMETTEAQFDGIVNVHFKGVYFLTQKLAPLMADGGRIVNVTSGLSRFTMNGFSVYGPMKAATDSLSRYLASELAPRGITVNALAPGAVATGFGGGHVRDDLALAEQMAALTVLGRVGQPDDIGAALVSLLSDDSRWITGQRIEASGGMCL